MLGSAAVDIPDRGVEQLVARRAHNPKVVGSSPTPATNTEGQVVSLEQLVPFSLLVEVQNRYNNS